MILAEDTQLQFSKGRFKIQGRVIPSENFFKFLSSNYLPPNMVRTPIGKIKELHPMRKDNIPLIINTGLIRVFPKESYAATIANIIQNISNKRL